MFNEPMSSKSTGQRIRRWLSMPMAQRTGLLTRKLKNMLAAPFYLGRPSAYNVYLAWHPDSYTLSGAHREFAPLFASFARYNKLNNAGDVTRLWSFILNCRQVMVEGIAGDFAELGVWRGNTASVLAHFATEYGRHVFLFDTFEGFNAGDIEGIDASHEVAHFNDTSINLVKSVIGSNSAACTFVPGHFPGTFTDEHQARRYAIVSLDCDLYEPMTAGLANFYPLLERGGILLLHDYSSLQWNGARLAIDEFCKASGEFIVLLPDKSGSAFLRKSH